MRVSMDFNYRVKQIQEMRESIANGGSAYSCLDKSNLNWGELKTHSTVTSKNGNAPILKLAS